MNKHTESMISLSSALLLFISACFFALGLTGEMNRALKESSITAQGQMKSIHSTLTSSEHDMLSGSQVVLSIIDNKESHVSIEVGGFIFEGGQNAEMTDWSMVSLEADYSAIYQWEPNGQLKRIQFIQMTQRKAGW